METIEEILRKFEEHKDKYSATFDKETGKVISVGPTISFQTETNKIDLDKDLAEDILTGKISISNCFVDINSNSLEIVELKNIRKIDDVVHRIPFKKFSDITNPDCYVSYYKKNGYFKFELSKDLGGTKHNKLGKTRNIYWSGDTVMTFYVTKYNDPHWILYNFDVKIEELIGNYKIVKNITLPEKFSIFTRRLLKNYVLEIK